MAEARDNKEEGKLDFDSAGQAIGYISLDQARVVALRHARDNRDFYGRRYSRGDLIWEVVSAEETEDYYEIKLSYRPARGFRGPPGVEQFTIDKAGSIEFRQILDEPVEPRRLRLPPVLVALVLVVGLAAVIGVALTVGGLGGGDDSGLPPTVGGLLPSEGGVSPPEPEAFPRDTPIFDGSTPTSSLPSPSPVIVPAPQDTAISGESTPTSPIASPSPVIDRASQDTTSPIASPTLAIDPAPSPSVPQPGPVASLESEADTQGMMRGATISGRVTDAETGMPLADVEIDGQNVIQRQQGIYTRTDQDGIYTLDGVAPGSYRIRVKARGQGYIQEYYDNRLGWDYADLVVVGGAETLENIDFVLETGGTISGSVTDNATGLPILGARVGSDSLEHGSGSDAMTDSSGRYTLIGLAPGSHRVWADVEGQSYVRAFYKDVINWDDANLVAVNGQEEVEGVNLSLRRGASVSGRVVDSETSSPISDLQLRARLMDGDDVSWAESNVDGTYLLLGLPEGVLEIRIHGKGYIEERTRVTVRGQTPIEDFNLTLSLGASIAGRVFDEDTGFPIANLDVHAVSLPDRSHVAWESTDADGRFTLSGVAPGLFDVVAEGRGYVPHQQRVSVLEQERVTGLEMGLGAGGTVSGRVTDAATGVPVAGATVRHSWVDTEFGSEAVTNEQGRYRLTGLGEGRHHLQVEVRGQNYVQQFYSGKMLRDRADLVTIRGQEEISDVSFSLIPGAVISGRVVDSETGRPIPGMDLRARINGDDLADSTTNNEGVYVLRGIPNGEIEVAARGQGYIERRRVIQVRDGQDVIGVDF